MQYRDGPGHSGVDATIIVKRVVRYRGKCPRDHTTAFYCLNRPQEGADPRISPLRAPDRARLPPATVLTDEVNPLRDEGEAYTQRLRDAGMAVQSRRYTGVMHEFFSMPLVIAKAKQTLALASADLRAASGNSLIHSRQGCVLRVSPLPWWMGARRRPTPRRAGDAVRFAEYNERTGATVTAARSLGGGWSER